MNEREQRNFFRLKIKFGSQIFEELNFYNWEFFKINNME